MPNIVVMEDDLLFADQLKSDLTDRGHDVVVFSTPNSALKHIKNNATDLVIVDLFIRAQGKLQPDGGITMISKMKQSFEWHLPVIAISGSFADTFNADSVNSTAKTVGADITLAKPFLPTKLSESIDTLLAKYTSA